MPPKLALLIALAFIAFVFVAERKRNVDVSPALFWVLLWCLVAASRPVGMWLYLWGVPALGSDDPTEGSLPERLFYGTLMLIGMFLLARRRFEPAAWGRDNIWILLLFFYMAVSIVWSDYPMVSFKRLVKSFGAMIMALVVLTEANPMEAVSAVLRRCAYIHIPLSVIVIKYFRDIGVSFSYFGETSWVGIATSKNTLGQVAAVSALYFIWEWLRNAGNKEGRVIRALYLVMSLWLLKGADDSVSMTSLTVFALCLFVFWRLQRFEARPLEGGRFFVAMSVMILGMLGFFITHSLVHFPEDSLFGAAVKALGRDMTFTGRTEIWHDVYQVASRSPLVGVGYGAFWIGRLANIPWTEQMTWTLGQAHNGYVDTYLQLGWVGVFLLLAVIVSAMPRIVRSFHVDFEYGRFRMTFFLVILFVNITESTFLRGEHFLWFLFLLTALSLPWTGNQTVDAAVEATAPRAMPSTKTRAGA